MAPHRRTRHRRRRPDEPITASEIACYAYCPEQWRLHYGLELEPENHAVRQAGTRHHARKADAERFAGGALAIGRLVVAIALLALLLLWVLNR